MCFVTPQKREICLSPARPPARRRTRTTLDGGRNERWTTTTRGPDPGEEKSLAALAKSRSHVRVICGHLRASHMQHHLRRARYEEEYIELCQSGFGGQRYHHTRPEERDGRLTRCWEENQPNVQ